MSKVLVWERILVWRPGERTQFWTLNLGRGLESETPYELRFGGLGQGVPVGVRWSEETILEPRGSPILGRG